MARPIKPIDGKLVQALGRIHCTYDEIAAVLNCSKETLVRRFHKEFENGRNEGRVSLRRKQFELAMTGDKTMLIWVGKQILGQSERQEITGKDGAPITTFLELAQQALATTPPKHG